MTKEHFKTLTIILLVAFLLLGYVRRAPSSKENEKEITENIQLYSNGKLIGQWEGIGKGTFDGKSYVFKTNRGAYSREYRITGDFIIETLPN